MYISDFYRSFVCIESKSDMRIAENYKTEDVAHKRLRSRLQSISKIKTLDDTHVKV